MTSTTTGQIIYEDRGGAGKNGQKKEKDKMKGEETRRAVKK